MMPPCPRLIAVDLDGTSVRYEPRLEMDPVFIDCMRTLRPRGIAWIMNSDRADETMLEIASFLDVDDRPRAILSRQKDIFLNDGAGNYVAHEPWNNMQRLRHEELWGHIQPHFDVWLKEIYERFDILGEFITHDAFAFMTPIEQTHELRTLLESYVSQWQEAQVSGNQDWTFILHSECSKGNLLREAARCLGIPAQEVLAVGDGYNDLPMLDGSVTPLVGCPANSCKEIMAAVQNAEGFISSYRDANGTVDVIRHFTSAS